MLQYHITIIAYTQQLSDMDDLFGTSTNKLYSRHMNFYCKKLTQVEVGYGLLNVVYYVVSCKVLYFILFTW